MVQMSGNAEFNEVFLNNAVVPATNQLGELNQGWGVTLRVLSYERDSVDPETGAGIHNEIDRSRRAGDYAAGEVDDGLQGLMPKASEAWALLRELLVETGSNVDAVVRQDAMRVYSWQQIARFTALRAAAAADAGNAPGPEGSLGKLASTRSMRAWRDLILRALGPQGMLAGADGAREGEVNRIGLNVAGLSIAGGTDEVQRNIVGERILGLPREPRTPERQS